MGEQAYKVKIELPNHTITEIILGIPTLPTATYTLSSTDFGEMNLRSLSAISGATTGGGCAGVYTGWFLVHDTLTAAGISPLLGGVNIFDHDNLPDGSKIWIDDVHYITVEHVNYGSRISFRFHYYKVGTTTQFTQSTLQNINAMFSLPWWYPDNNYVFHSDNYKFVSIASLAWTSDNPCYITLYENARSYTGSLESWSENITPIPADLTDPYINIPASEPSGPAEGTGIPTTASIDIPTLPTVSVTDSGFIRLFNPSLGQVHDLASYMWSDSFDIATYKKLFADPMDCLLGFNMLPVSIPQGTAVAVKVGNISTGIQMYPATSQWVELDCGSIQLDLPYGCYLDYSPYTKFSIYLPYVGTQELSADDVVGKTITLKYHIDILSCACVAYLKCGSDTLYQFSGACGYSIPMSGSDYRQMINSAIEITKSLGGAILSGGMTAPMAMGAVGSAVQNVMNSKPEVHRSGTIAGANGILGIQKPYLIVEYPNACKPERQYHYTGFPSFVTVTVGNLSGYTEFEEIIVSGVPCTDEERKMIQAQCAGGIYL